VVEDDLVLGGILCEARIRADLSKKRAAQEAGVSRRHLSDAEKGKNISVAILRKLLLRYGIAITLDGKSTNASITPVDGRVGAALAKIDEQASEIRRTIASLEAAAGVATHELNDRASSLITSFANHLSGLSENDLCKVEQSLAELVSPGVRPRTTKRVARKSVA